MCNQAPSFDGRASPPARHLPAVLLDGGEAALSAGLFAPAQRLSTINLSYRPRERAVACLPRCWRRCGPPRCRCHRCSSAGARPSRAPPACGGCRTSSQSCPRRGRRARRWQQVRERGWAGEGRHRAHTLSRPMAIGATALPLSAGSWPCRTSLEGGRPADAELGRPAQALVRAPPPPPPPRSRARPLLLGQEAPAGPPVSLPLPAVLPPADPTGVHSTQSPHPHPWPPTPRRYVLLKERNLLHSEKLLFKARGKAMLNPSRLTKVRMNGSWGARRRLAGAGGGGEGRC